MTHSKDLIAESNNQQVNTLFVVVERLFPELSTRESQTLYWVATGFHSSDIATMMGCSESTIKTFIKRCKTKLNSTDNTDLRLVYHNRMHNFQTDFMLKILSHIEQ